MCLSSPLCLFSLRFTFHIAAMVGQAPPYRDSGCLHHVYRVRVVQLLSCHEHLELFTGRALDHRYLPVSPTHAVVE